VLVGSSTRGSSGACEEDNEISTRGGSGAGEEEERATVAVALEGSSIRGSSGACEEMDSGTVE